MRTVVFALLAGCGDNVPEYEPWLLEELEPQDGFWIRTPEFEVAPGAEIQDCYFFEVPGDVELWMDRASQSFSGGGY